MTDALKLVYVRQLRRTTVTCPRGGARARAGVRSLTKLPLSRFSLITKACFP